MTAIADETDGRTVEQLTQTVEQLKDTVEQLKDTVEDLKEENQELKEELAEHKDHVGREFADVRARITDVENQQNHQTEADSKGETPGVNGEKEGSQNAKTPLEQVVRLPEHLAENELSANQRRARFIAKDVAEYGESLGTGLHRITTSRLRTVLSAAAADGKRMYRTTAHRVMGFLDRLGGEHVTVRTTQNSQKAVYFTDEAIDRLETADRERRNGVCDGKSTEGLLRAV